MLPAGLEGLATAALTTAVFAVLLLWRCSRRPEPRSVPAAPEGGRGAVRDCSVGPAAVMCSVVEADDDGLVTTSYEEWSAVADDEDQIRTIASADLMEFYANEIVQDLAHRPHVELGAHSDSDSELPNYSGLETIVEETSDDMRSDTESLRSGPASWAWSQDSADVETVIDAGRGRDSRFEDDFNPMDGIDAALSGTGKLLGASRQTHAADAPPHLKYKQLFDFESFLKSGGAEAGLLGIRPPSPSQLPSLDPTFNTSATLYPFSDTAQAVPLAADGAPCSAQSEFRLGRVDRSYYTNPFVSLPPCSAEGPPELVFSLEDVLDHRTLAGAGDNERGNVPTVAPSAQSNNAPAVCSAVAAAGDLPASGEVLGAVGNGQFGVSTATRPASADEALSVDHAAGRVGREPVTPADGTRPAPGTTATRPTPPIDSKWDLGSCEDFENLNRRIESLTFDFEEEERRSLEFIDIVDTASSSEERLSSRQVDKDWKRPRRDDDRHEDTVKLRDFRVKRFHSFGDLSMITEDELQEAGSEHSLNNSDTDKGSKPASPGSSEPEGVRDHPRRRPAHLGLLRHSSENLSEDSGYGDHAGDRVSPQDPSARSASLPQGSSPQPAIRSTPSRPSSLGRLSKSTSDLSPCTQRRSRLLELISRDDERRARLYADARPSDARLPSFDAPPPVAGAGDGGDGDCGGGDGDCGGGGSVGGGGDGQTDVESVLVMLDDEESNSVIQVLRDKVRARSRDKTAGPVPAPRSISRAPAVYQNLPPTSRVARGHARSSEPPLAESASDVRAKRDMEQFERIKEAFLEKGTYNVYDDMVSWRSPQKGLTRTRSTPDLSLDTSEEETAGWTEALRESSHRCFADKPGRSARELRQSNGRDCVNKGDGETQHDSDRIQGRGQAGTRGGFESDGEPRDIYLSEGEVKVLPMYRSSAGRPKPLDLKLAEEFLLLEGIGGVGYALDEYQCDSLSPCSDCHSQSETGTASGEGSAECADQPIGAACERTTRPAWSGRDAAGAAGSRRSRSLWNLSGVHDAADSPLVAGECCADWHRSRNRNGSWLLSKSVQDLWSEDNMDSPRRLDFYNQTMEWPGSGDYLAHEADVADGKHAARAPPRHRSPLNLDGAAGVTPGAEVKFGQPSDICSSWLLASMEPESGEQRSLSGHFLFEPAVCSAAQLTGSPTTVDGTDAVVRTMSANNSFTARVPLKTYGPHNEVEVYISRDCDQSAPPPPTVCEQAAVVKRDKSRGVQFSPVVSEVQWRESYLDDEPNGQSQSGTVSERRPMQSFQHPSECMERQRDLPPPPRAPADHPPPPPVRADHPPPPPTRADSLAPPPAETDPPPPPSAQVDLPPPPPPSPPTRADLPSPPPLLEPSDITEPPVSPTAGPTAWWQISTVDTQMPRPRPAPPQPPPRASRAPPVPPTRRSSPPPPPSVQKALGLPLEHREKTPRPGVNSERSHAALQPRAVPPPSVPVPLPNVPVPLPSLPAPPPSVPVPPPSVSIPPPSVPAPPPSVPAPLPSVPAPPPSVSIPPPTDVITMHKPTVGSVTEPAMLASTDRAEVHTLAKDDKINQSPPAIIRGRRNGGKASPVVAKLQDMATVKSERSTKLVKSVKSEKPEKAEKSSKSSMLVRLGLGRLSGGRSKPKLPPKPEGIKPTSRSPSPQSSAPDSPPSVLPPRNSPPQLPSPISSSDSPRSPGSFGASAATSTPVTVQKAAPTLISPPPEWRTPTAPSVKSEFHAPHSPAVRAKSLSLPKSADICLDGEAGPAADASSRAAVAKPPLPPQSQRLQTQANRARLTSARRNFFQLEQQRVIPLRSVPQAPVPDAAGTCAGGTAVDIKDAFERFRRRAREDRERLAKSTPDLSLIEAATRSLVRPLPAPVARPAIDRPVSGGSRRATDTGSDRSVTLQEDGNVVILHAAGGGGGGARAARPHSKSKDRFAHRRAAALARARSRSAGVLETDLDAPDAQTRPETDLDAIVRNLQVCIDEASPKKEKAKSLLNLDQNMEFSLAQGADSRAKSMEFLMDEENKSAVQPPENELMRGERQMSEHELSFQRSLRNLNTPEWYKKSAKHESPLRRDYGSGSLAGGWSGFNSKSTSKESLQSSRCTTPTAQSKVVIPTRVRPPDWRYVRTTSRESLTSPGSGAASPTPSDRSGLYYGGGMYRYGSARVSQTSSGTQSPVGSAGGSLSGGRVGQRPYMGWRSQERLSQGYQTPVDRLATSFARNRSEGNLSAPPLSLPRAADSSGFVGPVRPLPPDVDIHSSIKEVTSAIVHYFDSAASTSNQGSVSDMGRGGGSPRSRRRSPAGARGSRSTSPSKRPVWLETAFVGTKPTDEPTTPEAASVVIIDTLAAGSVAPPPSSDQSKGDQYEFGELLMV